ncbi:MAG: hypothetical protein LBL15_08815 [Oscillospiraceae bacterium]|jgi:hypothetical protein|nr:hypothetical protein [Oscillospiraceae bacterium]
MSKAMTNNPVEDELNAIRIKLYEQTKDMMTQERVAFFNKMAQERFARHGIKANYGAVPVVRERT